MCEHNAGEGSLLPAWHWRLVCLKSRTARVLPLPVPPADRRVPASKRRKAPKKPSGKRKGQ
jgi:hypothetical protein